MAQRLWYQSPKNVVEKSDTDYEKALAEAIEARDKLLRERPSLQAYQDEIDRALQNVIGYEDRMAVLGVMMEAKISQLRDSVSELQSVAHRLDSLLQAAMDTTEDEPKTIQ